MSTQMKVIEFLLLFAILAMLWGGCARVSSIESQIRPDRLTAFVTQSTSTSPCAGAEIFLGNFRGTFSLVETGDEHGTMQSDMLCHFPSTGEVDLYLIDPSGNLSEAPAWRGNFCAGVSGGLHVGDFNGDGRADLLCKNGSSMSIAYGLPDGTPDIAHTWSANIGFCIAPGQSLFVGDFNGDGYSDLLCHAPDGGVGILYGFSLSAPDASGAQVRAMQFGWNSAQYPNAEWDNGALGFCAQNQIVIGDFDGDGKDDVACHVLSTGGLSVMFADVNGHLGSGSEWDNLNLNFCAGAQIQAADFLGNGREDLVCSGGGGLWILYSLGSRTGLFSWGTEWDNLNHGWKFCNLSGDKLFTGFFDRNVRADLACVNSISGAVNFLFSDLSGHFAPLAPPPLYNVGVNNACSSAPGVAQGSNAGTDDSKYNVADSYSSFVEKLYPALLGRSAGRVESYPWATQLRQGGALTTAAYQIGNSTEGRCNLVRFFSGLYFFRDLSSDFTWYSMCHETNGYSWPQDWKTVVYDMVNSSEFFQDAGGTLDGYALALYAKLLGRSWTSTEGKWWTGMAVPTIASAFVNTPETSQHLTSVLYSTFLHRLPDSTEINLWAPTLQVSGIDYAWVLSQFLSSTEFRIGATASLCGIPVDISGTTGVGATLNYCIQKTIASCQATNTSPCYLDLPRGVYQIDHQIVISGPITLRTLGVSVEFPTIGCLSHSAIQDAGQDCATLVAAANLNEGMLVVQPQTGSPSVQNVFFDHIVLNGNHFDRLRNLIDSGANRSNLIGFNGSFLFCSRCGFNFGGSVNALGGTGLHLYGDSLQVVSSVFRDNGQGYMWQQGKVDIDSTVSDGLTLGYSSNACIEGNQFINNTDMDFISGGGSNSQYVWNTVYHDPSSWLYSNGGMMLDNFAGNTDGNFANTLIANNTILCNRSAYSGDALCKVALRIGPHSYYTFRHGAESFTTYHNHRLPNILGGVIKNNFISGGGQGILVSGSGDPLSPTVIAGNVVTNSSKQEYFTIWGAELPNLAQKFQSNCQVMSFGQTVDPVGRPAFLVPTNAYSVSPDSFIDTAGDPTPFVARAWQKCY